MSPLQLTVSMIIAGVFGGGYNALYMSSAARTLDGDCGVYEKLFILLTVINICKDILLLLVFLSRLFA